MNDLKIGDTVTIIQPGIWCNGLVGVVESLNATQGDMQGILVRVDKTVIVQLVDLASGGEG